MQFSIDLFDAQYLAAQALSETAILDMKTGEGKTFAAALAAIENVCRGQSTHIHTVNDYLARRDADWLKPIYAAFQIRVGCLQNGQKTAERQQQYGAEVVYGASREFGFDHLRDTVALDTAEKLQRDLEVAIIDEADAILLDEARTPLSLSSTQAYDRAYLKNADRLARYLLACEKSTPDQPCLLHDNAQRRVNLTELGIEKIEAKAKIHNLYAVENSLLLHSLEQALVAHCLFSRDKDYCIVDREVIAIDPVTGRAMPGRRWGDGLHLAIEQKEGLQTKNETVVVAETTFRSFFQQYTRLSGMSGTASTDATELESLYGLRVIKIPVTQASQRLDHQDRLFLTAAEKLHAATEIVQACRAKDQPVVIGTVTVEQSELVSSRLRHLKISHRVLNAKNHQQEAQILLQAGRPGAVTIVTSIAGRGTDIVLGGQRDADESETSWTERRERVIAAGGLFILGFERQDCRRYDLQLVGRAGRQGDVGESQFLVSLEDRFLKQLGEVKLKKLQQLCQTLQTRQTALQTSHLSSHAVRSAQAKIETFYFQARKSLLRYEVVIEMQRRAHLNERCFVFDTTTLEQYADFLVESQDYEDFTRKAETTPEAHKIFRQLLLRNLDFAWQQQLRQLTALRDDMQFRTHTSRNLVNDFQREAFDLFQQSRRDAWRRAMRQFLAVTVTSVQSKSGQRHLTIQVQDDTDADTKQLSA